MGLCIDLSHKIAVIVKINGKELRIKLHDDGPNAKLVFEGDREIRIERVRLEPKRIDIIKNELLNIQKEKV